MNQTLVLPPSGIAAPSNAPMDDAAEKAARILLLMSRGDEPSRRDVVDALSALRAITDVASKGLLDSLTSVLTGDGDIPARRYTARLIMKRVLTNASQRTQQS